MQRLADNIIKDVKKNGFTNNKDINALMAIPGFR